MIQRMFCRSCLIVYAFCWVLASFAQTQEDRFYYAVEDMETGTAVLRGSMSNAGIPTGELILAPQRTYRIWALNGQTLRVGLVEVTTPRSGREFEVPGFLFRAPFTIDTDQDGLHNDGEFIIGTNPTIADTDADGLLDGTEVIQGLNPLDGFAVQTGIIATIDTPGNALDVYAFDDLAVVADSQTGVSLFNVFNALEPMLIGRIDTPGQAVAVHGNGTMLAVADSSAGLAIIDINDPPNAFIRHQVASSILGGAANCVVSAAGIAYVGTTSHTVAAVDMASGTLLSRIQIGSRAIQDITLGSDFIYALANGELFTLSLTDGGLTMMDTVSSPGSLGAGRRRQRLFAGSDILYASHTSGYNTFDLTTPDSPSLSVNGSTTLFGWKQLVTNGSGLGIAAVSPNSTNDGPHHISLYNTSDPLIVDDFVATFETPGLAAAVTIYNGLAYVADSAEGLQVLNYLAFDVGNTPPTINLSTNFPQGVAEEGRQMRLIADVGDDVQVRNVAFYIDGVKVSTDGNYPFEHRFVTPTIVAANGAIRVRARVSDTGGNATWSDALDIELIPDATPPVVISFRPLDNASLNAVSSVRTVWSEIVDSATLNANSWMLTEAGPDEVSGTGDDITIQGEISFNENTLTALMTLQSPLDPGDYQVRITPVVRDLAGNAMVEEVIWNFRIWNLGQDSDGDLLPDDMEIALGLDPQNPDSDGDDIPDGQEDFDNDGLNNFGELLAGTDPNNPDTNGNGISDANEDADLDGLSNAQEVALGTNLLAQDSDGDTWPDGAEVDGNSDPTDAASVPRGYVFAKPSKVRVILPGTLDPNFQANTTVAQPSAIRLTLPSSTSDGLAFSTSVAQPTSVRLTLPSTNFEGQTAGTTLASPPVRVSIATAKTKKNLKKID